MKFHGNVLMVLNRGIENVVQSVDSKQMPLLQSKIIIRPVTVSGLLENSDKLVDCKYSF